MSLVSHCVCFWNHMECVLTRFTVQYGFVICQEQSRCYSSLHRSKFTSLYCPLQLYMNEVLLATVCGILFGPYYANIFNPRAWGGDINVITLEVMRITLAAGLFAIGVELPRSYLAHHAKGLLIMVVPTMAFGWLIVASACQHYIL